MARKYKDTKNSGKSILLVDDNPDYLEATRLVLEHEGHKVYAANGGKMALELLHMHTVDLVLLDYFMPEMTGEEVVTEMRKFSSSIQIILQTGYSSENPPREMLQRLNIQGYYDKSEGTEKLLLWVDIGLKSAYTVSLLNKSRQGLNYILDITPEMHKIQPLDDLLQGILWQLSGLLGFSNSFLASLPGCNSEHMHVTCEGFLAMLKDDMILRIHAGIGRFSGKIIMEDVLDASGVSVVTEILNDGKVRYAGRSTFIPLRVGETTLGFIYLDENIQQDADLEMLYIFANQAAVAIQNAKLYEMATRDPLTGVFIRRYAVQLLTKELRSAFHSCAPLSIIMFDLDELKKINDTAGHPSGDRALALLGKVLKKSIRTGDFAGRIGGDEFIIVLPGTEIIGATNVGDRIIKSLVLEKIYGPGEVYALSGSMGIVSLNARTIDISQFPHPLPHLYFQAMVQVLLKKADEMMYTSKKTGNNTFQCDEPLDWYAYSKAMDCYNSIDTSD